jgi:flagellar motor switch protein FliG
MEAGRDFVRRTAEARTAKDAARDSGYRKAAQFLILIGDEQAAQVLRYLTEEEVEGITREIAAIDRISDADALKVLEEFGVLARQRRGAVSGGVNRAREMLESSLGKERGGEVFERVRKRIGPSFRFMRSVDPHQAAALLREESVAVTSAVLTQIEPAQAARILSCFPPEGQRDIASRIARMSRLSPDVLEKVRESLEGKLDAQGRIVTLGVDGRSVLAAIAKAMGAAAQTELIAGLEASDPELASSVQERLFGVETALELSRRDLGRLLAGMADREIALLAKGAGPTVREALLAAVTPRRRELIADEEDLAASLPPVETARAARDFAALLRRCWQEGSIRIAGRGEELA